jgi:enoyl-[acyl-carrier protein] reductase II
LLTHEANVHVNYKMAVKESELGQTVLVGDVYPVRVVKNSFTQQMQVLQDNPSTHAQAQQLFEQTSLKQAAFLGDVLWGKIEAGQSAGLIDEVLSVSELMGNLTHQMKHAFERMKNLSEGL